MGDWYYHFVFLGNDEYEGVEITIDFFVDTQIYAEGPFNIPGMSLEAIISGLLVFLIVSVYTRSKQ